MAVVVFFSYLTNIHIFLKVVYECWTFLDWRLNSENDSLVHGQPPGQEQGAPDPRRGPDVTRKPSRLSITYIKGMDSQGFYLPIISYNIHFNIAIDFKLKLRTH